MKNRIIPTILTDGNTVVKGEKFNNWRTVGSAEATARLYAARDVDELIFLDVNASRYGRSISSEMVSRFADILMVPFGVGGGINSLETATKLLRAGAEKVILGEAAISNPSLITQIATKFGSQAVTVSIDLEGPENIFFRTSSSLELNSSTGLDHAQRVLSMGAGEILLQSRRHDGLRLGMDMQNIELFSANLTAPLIASSGAGNIEDFAGALRVGASAVAAGAIFQFTEITPGEVRESLRELGFSVRNQ